MNLLKINNLLALAFQTGGDGPYEVVVTYDNGTFLSGSMMKDRIAFLSEKESVKEIKIATRLKNRRKTERPAYQDRRFDKKNLTKVNE